MNWFAFYNAIDVMRTVRAATVLTGFVEDWGSG